MEWRCFHCDEVFTSREAAAEHFGPTQECEPLCQVTAERYREVERQLESYRTESDATSRTFFEMGAKSVIDVRAAEERGYASGLRDGTDRAVRVVRTLAASEPSTFVDSDDAVVLLRDPDFD